MPAIFAEDKNLMTVRMKRVLHRTRGRSGRCGYEPRGRQRRRRARIAERRRGGALALPHDGVRRDDVRHFAGLYIHHLKKTKDGYRIKLQRVDMTNAQAAYDYVLQVWCSGDYPAYHSKNPSRPLRRRRQHDRFAPRLALAAALAAISGIACSQEITLRLVSAFPENQFYVKRTLDWIADVNKDGKASCRSTSSRAEGDPDFEVGKRCRPAWSTSASAPGLLHQRDARSGHPQALGDQRRGAAQERRLRPHQQDLAEKGNMRYLAKVVEFTPSISISQKIDKPDLTGLKIRITPVTGSSSSR